MSGLARLTLAVVLAGSAHVAAFALVAPRLSSGATGAGDAGTQLTSISAAPGDLSALIEAWDSPPVASPIADNLAMPSLDAAAGPILPADAPKPRIAPPLAPAPVAPMQDTAMIAPGLPEPPPIPREQLTPPPPKPVAKVPDPVKPPAKATTKPKAKTKAVNKPGKSAAQAASQAASLGQKAAGKGKTQAAGSNGSATAATQSAANTSSLRSSWGASIRARIEKRKRYPASAQGKGGKVTLRFTVSRSGALLDAGIAKGSGIPALDEAALKALRAAGAFPSAPKGLTEASYSFTLPITFSR